MANKLRTRSWHTSAGWLYLLILALLLYVLVPQIGTFHASLPLLKTVSLPWLVLAIAFSFCAHVVAGFKYISLGLRPLRLYPTVIVQLASLLVNRLLPAGIGGIGLNYSYLYKMKHSKVEAGVVVTMNNLVGFVGHMLLVVVLLAVGPATASQLHASSGTSVLLVMFIVIIALLGVAIWQRKNLANTLTQLKTGLHQYRRRPLKLVQATCWSVIIAAAYAACLWASAHALHIELLFIPSLLVLTVGVAASTVTPTPGGLVGVEAALVAGLVAYHVTATNALAIALLYRLITYWLPLVLGSVAFIIARKQRYI